MADPRDFMLSIGAKLVDGDITKITDQIKAAFKEMPQLELRGESLKQLTRDMEAGIPVTKQMAQAIKDSNEWYKLTDSSVSKFALSLEKESAAEAKASQAIQTKNEKLIASESLTRAAAESQSRAWQESVNKTVAAMAVMHNAIVEAEADQKMLAVATAMRASHENQVRNNLLGQQSSLMANNQAQRDDEQNEAYKKLTGPWTKQSQDIQVQQMLDANKNAQEVHAQTTDTGKGMAEGLREIDVQAEKATATFSRYTPALMAGVEAHRRMNLVLPEGIANMKGFADEFTHMIGQFALWSAGAHLIEGGVGMISKGMSDAIHSEKEQNITGQYYKAAGGDYTPAMSEKAQESAIDLARIYGLEVVHVQENIGLWAKVTGGELVPAIGLANKAMELSAVSGMNMEEVYRDGIAVMGQLQEPLSRTSDLFNVATGLALKYGGGIQTLGGQTDDAVKQMMDGMTRLTAVMTEGLGRTPETLQKVGAMIATVGHLTNETGDEVGNHLASAFAKIEGAPIEKQLGAIGIKVRDNINLFEEMGAQYGKVLPILEKGGVKAADLHILSVAVQGIDTFKTAVTSADRAIKESAMDKVFESMLKTTDQQLKQAKAGWEAIGIAIGREFIPYMQAAADVGNNKLIPSLLANKTVIAESIKEVVGFGLAFAGWSIIKTVVGMAIRTYNDLEMQIGKTTAVESVSSRAMITDLTAYQRKCLDVLATTGEADEEMIMSVKRLAIQHKVSVDQIILQMSEVELAASRMLGTVSSDEELMATDTSLVAIKMGASASIIESQFAGISSAGVAMSVKVGAAFMAMIPWIGAGIVAYQVGSAAISQEKVAHENYLRTPQGAPDKAKEIAASYARQHQDEQSATIYRNAINQLTMHPNAGHHHSADLESLTTDLSNVSDSWNRENAFQKRMDAPADNRLPQDLTIKAIMAKAAAETKDAMAAAKKIYSTKPQDPQTFEDAAGTGKIKGLASGNAVNGLDIDSIATKYHTLQASIEGQMKATDANIAIDERQISIYGDTKANVDALIQSLTVKNALEKAEIYNNNREINDYSWEKNHLQNTLPAKGTQARVDQESKINELQRKIDDLTSKNESLQGNRLENNNSIYDSTATEGSNARASYLKTIKSGYSAALSGLTSAKTPGEASSAYSAFSDEQTMDVAALNAQIAALNGIAAAKGKLTLQQQASLKAAEDELATITATTAAQDAYTAVLQKVATDSAGLREQLIAPYDVPLQTAIKAVTALTQEYNADQLASRKANGGESQQIADWANLKLQIIQTTYAQAEYQKQVEQFQKSAAYSAISGVIDTVGKSLDTSLFDSLNKRPNYGQQEQQDQTHILQLQQEKSLLQGQVYTAQRDDIDRQIRALTQQEDATKQNASRPSSLLTGLIQDIEKSVISATLTNAETNLKKTVTEAFLGPAPKDVATKTVDAANTMKLTIEKFVPSVDKFGVSVDKLVPALTNGKLGAGAGYSPGLGAASPTGDNAPADPNSPTINSLGQAIAGSTAAGAAGTLAVTAGTTATKTLNTSLGLLTKSIGSIMSIAGGFSAGGITGGLEAGTGVMSLLKTIAPNFGPWGAAIAGAVGIGTALIHQDNPALMPDKYDSANYGQFVANFNGATSSNPAFANGTGYSEDSATSTVTGGLSEGAYIENFLKGKSAAQLASVFGTEAPAIQSAFGAFSENGGITDLHNGNVNVSGQTMNWQQLQTEGQDAFSAITAAANSLNQALAPIISISAYGRGSNSATFSPYYTPGYGDTSALSSIPYPSLFAQSPTTAAYNAAPSAGTATIATTINLDGQQIAQTVSQYRSQQQNRGFQADS